MDISKKLTLGEIMRKPIIAGNWKMNKTISEGTKFINDIKSSVAGTDVEVVVFAPFVMLSELKRASDGTNVKIGAQNMHYEKSGAFTGEISAEMLKDIDIDYVIIGHSERRMYYNETDDSVNKKLKKAIEVEITPILCVGETLEQRESGQMNEVVKAQITKALDGILANDMKNIVVAYEPIWAIGTGKTASAMDAQNMLFNIRETIKEIYGDDISEEVRLQYGGSVKPANVETLMNQDDIDGALVGGASLEAESFVQLVNF